MCFCIFNWNYFTFDNKFLLLLLLFLVMWQVTYGNDNVEYTSVDIGNSTWNIRWFYVEKWSSGVQILFNVESTSMQRRHFDPSHEKTIKWKGVFLKFIKWKSTFQKTINCNVRIAVDRFFKATLSLDRFLILAFVADRFFIGGIDLPCDW